MIERIASLIEEEGITASKLSKDLGFNSGAISNWKKGRAKPGTEAIIKIADYFNVTTDYLLGRYTNQIAADNALMRQEDEQLFRDGINAYFEAAGRKGFNVEAIAGLFPQSQGMTANKIGDFQMHREIPTHGEFFRMLDIFDWNSSESPPACHYMLARLYEIKREAEQQKSDDIRAAALIDELGTALDKYTADAS